MENSKLIAAIISSAGGEINGKTRLQKTLFLLQEAGLNSKFSFRYHHFGPYSAEAAKETEFAEFLGEIKSETRSGNYEIPFTIYSSDYVVPNKVLNLSRDDLKDIIDKINSYDSIVLEIAATLRYLQVYEKIDAISDRDGEVSSLKPHKVNEIRLTKAHKLLSDLNLE